MSESPSPVTVLGVRHHGPGSARSVAAALEEIAPDIVLVEAPTDADPLLPMAVSAGMEPPVALLAYAADDPSVASFWPMAVFSPEWQAIRYAAERGLPVRGIDVPAAWSLARRPPPSKAPADPRADPDAGAMAHPTDGDPADKADPAAQPGERDLPTRIEREVREDPLALLSAVAGLGDVETWWEDVVESRPGGIEGFAAVAEAMTELRRARGIPALPTDEERWEEVREAHMRKVLRAAVKEGHARIAVVCGAWHVPALAGPLPPAAADARTLRGAARRKVSLTWVPWTHGRLAQESGYGAGVTSPGWYAHLFSVTDEPIADWLTRVANTLRRQDLPVSTAHIIEGVRLAEALARLRGRPLPGLAEVTEATRAVLCEGNDLLVDLVTRDLVVGEVMGAVPEGTPTVPLESDLAAICRRLRFKREPVPSTKDLDLRKPTDAERSRLLHRLRLLRVPWGTPAESAVRGMGTFRETWELVWRPELALEVVEASVWGTTVESAATARAISDALGADLPGLTRLVEQCLLAGLGDALPDLVRALDARAARDHDVSRLMQALPPLVRSLRYGDVRETDTGSLGVVADALLARVCAGLPAAVASLDDDGAEQLLRALDGVHSAVALRDDPGWHRRWVTVLASLVGRADVHGLLAGRLVRLLLDAGELDREHAGARLSRALSVGSTPREKAAWVEGFLSGSGLLLVHDAGLLALLDEWVGSLGGDDFLEVAPLLRRTFGRFAGPERRQIGQAARHLDGGPRAVASALDLDLQRAAPAYERVAQVLGLRPWSAS